MKSIAFLYIWKEQGEKQREMEIPMHFWNKVQWLELELIEFARVLYSDATQSLLTYDQSLISKVYKVNFTIVSESENI